MVGCNTSSFSVSIRPGLYLHRTAGLGGIWRCLPSQVQIRSIGVCHQASLLHGKRVRQCHCADRDQGGAMPGPAGSSQRRKVRAPYILLILTDFDSSCWCFCCWRILLKIPCHVNACACRLDSSTHAAPLLLFPFLHRCDSLDTSLHGLNQVG